MSKKYCIRDSGIFFIRESSTGEELNSVYTTFDKAQQFTADELRALYIKHKPQWESSNYKIVELKLEAVDIENWTILAN